MPRTSRDLVEDSQALAGYKASSTYWKERATELAIELKILKRKLKELSE